MNGDTMETAEQYLKDAGAISKCPTCLSCYVLAYDEAAERRAYALATNGWKAGVPGFRGMTRKEVIGVIKSVVEDTPSSCSRCTWS